MDNKLQVFEDRKIRSVWDDEKEEWFFSVVDVVQILTDSADTKQYIKRMRTRDLELNANWGTICTPLHMKEIGLKNAFCVDGGAMMLL